MERSELNIGDNVAVATLQPTVNGDLYSDWNAQFILRGVVQGKPDVGGVQVGFNTHWDGNIGVLKSEIIPSRRILCLWSRYLEKREERAADALGSKRNRQERLEREAQALTSAQKRYRSARIEGDNIVIDVDDWLEG